MEPLVFALVLLAAFLHAAWNALIKGGQDRLTGLGVLTLWSGALSALALPFLPVPSAAAWPFLAGSVVLHIGYRAALARSYEHGDLGLVYPIARGLGPLLVALFAILVVGETMPPAMLAGVAVVGIGIMSLALRGGAPILSDPRPTLLALLTGLFIAGYTVVDGLGGRANGDGPAYVLWLLALDAPVFVAIVALRRGPARFAAAVRAGALRGAAGAAMSVAAYALVVWAMTRAPLPAVAALRETSVIFAALLGTLVLHERFSRWRLAASVMVVAGVVLLRP